MKRKQPSKAKLSADERAGGPRMTQNYGLARVTRTRDGGQIIKLPPALIWTLRLREGDTMRIQKASFGRIILVFIRRKKGVWVRLLPGGKSRPLADARPLKTDTQSYRRMEAALGAEIRHYEKCLARIGSLHADVLAAGKELFEDERKLALWLCRPASALGGSIPLLRASAAKGRAEVIHLLGAIEHGVYL